MLTLQKLRQWFCSHTKIEILQQRTSHPFIVKCIKCKCVMYMDDDGKLYK